MFNLRIPFSRVHLILGLHLLIGFVLGCGQVAAQTPLQLTAGPAQMKISSAHYVLTGLDQNPETLAQPQWETRWRTNPKALDNSHLEPGPATVWLRFSVEIPATAGELPEWWLVPNWATFSRIRLSLRNEKDGSWWHSRDLGFLADQSQTYVDHRYFIFPLPIEAGTRYTGFLNLGAPEFAAVPVSIWEREAFASFDQQQLIILGLFFGSLVIMLLYNLSLFTILRDRAYLIYSAYVACVVLYELSITGLGFHFIWQGSTWLSEHSMLLFASASFLLATLFVRQFLSLSTQKGWLLAANSALLVTWSIVALLTLFWNGGWLGQVMNQLGAFTCITALVTTAVLWLRGSNIAKLFTYAWSVLIVGTMLHVLALEGVLPMNTFTRYAQMVGFIVELVLLSFALAYRINTERAQREQAQTEMLGLTMRVSEERNEKLRAQIQTLAVQKKLNDELESRVQQRTEQLKEAMERLELANDELTKLSITDPLTKVANRRYFDQVVEDEYKRACRLQHPLALILFDLDHFKAINDTFGHYVGDECLVLVAKAVKAAAKRPGDLCARYGGEEFVMILPVCSEADAAAIADEARQAVANISYRSSGQMIQLSVSAGVAAWTPERDHNHEALLKAADAALYRAKRAGRNRVVKASSEGKVIPIQGIGE